MDPRSIASAARRTKIHGTQLAGEFLSDEEYDKLQANCPHHWLKALLCVAYTYRRRGAELVVREQRNQGPMLVKQIDLKNRSMGPDSGAAKNEDARTIKDFRGSWMVLTKAVGLPRP